MRDIKCTQSIWPDYLHGRELFGERSVHWKIKTDIKVEVRKVWTRFSSGLYSAAILINIVTVEHAA
jgi:hypothetical protein